MITEAKGRGSKSHNSVYVLPHSIPAAIGEEVGISSVILLSKSFHYSERHLEFSQSSSKSSREYLDFSRKKNNYKICLFAMRTEIMSKNKVEHLNFPAFLDCSGIYVLF